MFILGTICCRGGSKGVPGKNIRCLFDKPLIVYTIEAGKKSLQLNDLIVSTDSDEIAGVAKQYSIAVPFIRPNHLATDEASKWPVFIHAVETYESQTGLNVDYIVDIDVTVPLKTHDDIDGAICMAIKNPEVDVVITGYESEKNPYFNMMEIGGDGLAKLVKKQSPPIVRRQDAPKVYSLSGAAFVIKKSSLYRFEHWSQAICKVYPMPRERAVDIDNEVDFKIIESLLNPTF